MDHFEQPLMRAGFVLIGILFLVAVVAIVYDIAVSGPAFLQNGGFWNIVGLIFGIWVISWIFFPRRRRWHRHWDTWDSGPEEILRRRYARGEITDAQFTKMMKVLKKEVSGRARGAVEKRVD